VPRSKDWGVIDVFIDFRLEPDIRPIEAPEVESEWVYLPSECPCGDGMGELVHEENERVRQPQEPNDSEDCRSVAKEEIARIGQGRKFEGG